MNLQPVIYSNVGIFDEFYPIEVNFNAKLTGLKAISMQYCTSKTISLKVYDIYGKLVGKNQAVKIKIGKKTFTAKTDKNGVVKLKINGKRQILSIDIDPEIVDPDDIETLSDILVAAVNEAIKKVDATTEAEMGKITGGMGGLGGFPGVF